MRYFLIIVAKGDDFRLSKLNIGTTISGERNSKQKHRQKWAYIVKSNYETI